MDAVRTVAVRLQLLDELSGPLRSATSNVSGAFNALAGGAQSVGNSIGGAMRGLAGTVTGALGSIKDTFFTTSTAAAVASAAMSAAIVKLTSDTLESASKFQKFRIAAEMFAGSEAAADKFAAAITRVGLQSQFSIEQVAELGSRILGNTKNVDQSTNAMRVLVDTVSATGGGFQELEGATRAYIQTSSKARASSEELNRQFANANIPVLRVLSEAIVNDVNHPLRQYLDIANGGGTSVVGATKAMTTAFTKANEQLPILAKRSEAAEMRLKSLKDAGKENTAAFKSAEATVMSYHQKLDAAQASINTYNTAQKGTVTVSKEVKTSVEDIMSQLQELGNLNIPGKLMADEIIKALDKAYGGGAQKLINNFGAQMQQLKERIGIVSRAAVGLKDNWEVVEGSLIDRLTKGLAALNQVLDDNIGWFTGLGQVLGSSIIPVMAGAFATLGLSLQIAAVGAKALGISLGMFLKWAIVGAIIGLVVEKLGLLDDAANNFVNLRGKIEPIVTFFQQKFERIGQITDNLRQKLAAKIFPDNMQAASASWMSFIENIYDKFLRQKIERAGQIIQSLKDKFVFGSDQAQLDASWSQVLQALSTKVKTKADEIGVQIQRLKNLFVFGNMDVGIATWGDVWNRIQGIIKVVGDYLSAIFAPAIANLQTAFANMQPILAQWAGIWETLKPSLEVVGQALLVVLGILITLFGAIVTGIATALGPLLQTVFQVFTGIVQVITGALSFILGLFTNNQQMMQQGWNTFWQGLYNVAIGLSEGIKATVWAFLTGVLNFFVVTFNTITNNAVPNFIKSVVAGFNSMKQQALDAVSSLISSITGKFNSLVSSAYNWGRDTINNFVNGIKNMIKNLGSAGKKVAESLGFGGLFEHGGIVPGPLGQEIPIIAHGGERVVPRSGADEGGFNAGSGITVNISGSFNLDDSARVQELADKIGKVLGRQMELAQLGAAY